MAARPEPPSAGGRRRTGRSAARPGKLSRDSIVDGALTFLDREGWDSLTINALATQLGTKGPSLYNHVDSLEDLRRAVRIRVIDDIIMMLNRVGEGRPRDDAILVMAAAYRSYAHHHPGRYSAFTRMLSLRTLRDALAIRSARARASASRFIRCGARRIYSARGIASVFARRSVVFRRSPDNFREIDFIGYF